LNFETIRKDARRYLGSSTVLDPVTENKIDTILDELIGEFNPRQVNGLFDIDIVDSTITFKGTKLQVESNDLAKVLIDSEKCILLACTLGIEIERKLKFLSANNLEMGILYDAVAAAYIEGYCDALNEDLKAQYAEESYYMTMRYSPGYGDVELHYQKVIIDVLNAYKRIGLTTNDSHLMIPRKSITAFIGLQRKPYINIEDRCDQCRLKENCQLRKGGRPCGVAK